VCFETAQGRIGVVVPLVVVGIAVVSRCKELLDRVFWIGHTCPLEARRGKLAESKRAPDICLLAVDDHSMALTYDDRAVVVGETLVLADLHVGKGSSNLELPVGDSTDTLDRLAGLLDRHDPSTVVVAGDLLHSFSTVPHTVEDTVETIRQRCREYGARPVVTPGNHDTMLDAVWSGPTTAEHTVGDTVVCHGHEAPTVDAERYVVGHDHPTIEIEGQRQPCYLVAENAYRGGDVVMMPAFNRLLAGVEINRLRATDFQSPLITDVDAARPLVWDEAGEETLEFPPLEEFREML